MLLISVLSRVDAIWLPCRDTGHPRWVNTDEDRITYRESGLPWISGAASEAGRKRSQRLLEALIGRGLIVLKRPKGSKKLFVKLSDHADRASRRAVGLPGVAETFELVKLVAKYSHRPATLITDVWIGEPRLLNGWQADPVRLADLQNLALPALVRGLLSSRSTSRRHVSYAVTADGWRLLDSSATPSVLGIVEPAEEQDRAYQFYSDRLLRYRQELASREPTQPAEIGPLPLLVSQHGVELACWGDA